MEKRHKSLPELMAEMTEKIDSLTKEVKELKDKTIANDIVEQFKDMPALKEVLAQRETL